ncbi:MAG TPA: hypothetical protein VMX17_13685 [Candidatus Glassbacteria bacterium]|nr:hypothetical protein [Candidatus Glassbacteria bacterium]
MNFNFDNIGNNLFEWVFTADNLVEAANILKEESHHWSGTKNKFTTFRSYRITDVVTMLYSMATECLLKALWLKTGNKLAENGKYVSIKGTKPHDLMSIAKEISKTKIIKFTKNDYNLLRELTHNVTKGRYPIETNKQKHNQPSFLPVSKFNLKGNILVEKKMKSYKDVKRILVKIYSILDEEIKQSHADYLNLTNRFT